MVKSVLLGDIGATNARFTLASGDVLGQVRNFEVAQYPKLKDALSVFLEEVSLPIAHAIIAVAGPIVGQQAKLTNQAWTIDAEELKSSFGLQTRIINDFRAVAFSLPLLKSGDLVAIGDGKIEEGAPKAVLGPGTGLGVACLAKCSAEPVVISSEGGHSTLAGTCDREDRIIQYLRGKFGHASAERAISGGGLENLYQAIAAIDGLAVDDQSAPEITNHALAGTCETAREALNTFCAFLGSFAGSLALTFGAKGGVYIAGGISPRIVNFLAGSEFRRRFESKGRFRSYLETIPSFVIVHPAAAFLGMQSLLDGIAHSKSNIKEIVFFVRLTVGRCYCTLNDQLVRALNSFWKRLSLFFSGDVGDPAGAAFVNGILLVWTRPFRPLGDHKSRAGRADWVVWHGTTTRSGLVRSSPSLGVVK